MLERGGRLEEASRGTNREIVGHLPAENIQQYKLHGSENMLEICEGFFFSFFLLLWNLENSASQFNNSCLKCSYSILKRWKVLGRFSIKQIMKSLNHATATTQN